MNHVIDIVIAINDTVLLCRLYVFFDYHLTVCTKSKRSCLRETVLSTNVNTVICNLSGYTYCHLSVSCAEIVIIITNLCKTGHLSFTINQIRGYVSLRICNYTSFLNGSNILTIRFKLIPLNTSLQAIGVNRSRANIGISISSVKFSTEEICCSIDFKPSIRMESRTKAIFKLAVSRSNPSSIGYTIFIKIINDSVNSLITNVKSIITACITIHTINVLPACLKNAVKRVVKVTVHFEHACTGFVNMSATLVGANELAIYDYIVVGNLNLRNDSTPINNRLTCLAVSSILVTLRKGICLLIKHAQFSVVLVVRRRNGCKLGCYVNSAAEAGCCVICESNLTVNDFCVNIYYGLITHFRYGYIPISYIIVTVISPNANGDAYQSIAQRLSLGSVNLLNSNCKKLGNFVVSNGSLEAVCYNCALGFPLICIVKLNLCYKLINLSKICNVDINVVNRLSLRSFTGVIMTAKLNNCITFYGEGSGKSCRVAKLVLDFKGYCVSTCNKDSISSGAKTTVINCGSYLDTVNENLTGVKVKSCIICDSRGECDLITVYNSTVFKSNGSIGSRISRS